MLPTADFSIGNSRSEATSTLTALSWVSRSSTMLGERAKVAFGPGTASGAATASLMPNAPAGGVRYPPATYAPAKKLATIAIAAAPSVTVRVLVFMRTSRIPGGHTSYQQRIRNAARQPGGLL